GGVMGWWATTRLGLDFFSGLLLVAVVLGTFGWLIDRFLIERIRDQGEEPGILLTIGLSIFLANTALLLVGTAPLKIESAVAGGPLFLGPIVLTKARMFAVGVSIVLMVVTYLVIQKTRLGRAMRATFQDPMAAKLVGIRTANISACIDIGSSDTNQFRATFQDPMAAKLVGIRTANIYAGTFAMGTVIASMAGMLLGSIYSTQVSIGGLVSMKAFVVVILGGMGSFAGAIVGGLLLGLAEALWGGYVATGWVDIIGFVLVILTLLFRPYGLFAKRAERA